MHLTSNGKMYIGLTKQKVESRWDNGRGYNGNTHFKNAIKKYGWENIEHIIIAENLNKEEAFRLEIDLIKWYDTTNAKNGYNKTPGGNFGLVICSEKTRQKMRQSRKGIVHTEETKKKISESHKGIKNPMFGKKQSKEHIEKRVKANSKPVLQFDLNMNFIKEWESATQAKLSFGIKYSSITDCCKGRQKTSLGYIWKLKSDYLMQKSILK